MLENIIVLGIIVSIIFYEWTHISPGGIIVPGYLVLFLDNPLRIFMTILLSIATYVTIKILSNYVILFGRRKFAVFIIISFILRYFIGMIFKFSNIPLNTALIIGYLVPGIIALDMDRQGIVKTLSAMFTVTFLLKFVITIYGVRY